MTRIIVIGDSGTGKTAFMIAATGQRMPHNVFRSTGVETFCMCRAAFYVIPGTCSSSVLRNTCDGADGILVICRRGCSAGARAWLQKVQRVAAGELHVPVIVCAHGDDQISSIGEDGVRLLQRYPNSEYAFTCNMWPEGIKDCANRIVCRVRRDPTTPIRCFEQDC